MEKPISACATHFEKSGVAGFNQPASSALLFPATMKKKRLKRALIVLSRSRTIHFILRSSSSTIAPRTGAERWPAG